MDRNVFVTAAIRVIATNGSMKDSFAA